MLRTACVIWLVFGASSVCALEFEGIPAYPGATVIAASEDEVATTHEFITSPVEKIRRELKIEQMLRVTARARAATFEAPQGTPLGELIEHYDLALKDDRLFECRGRDCGRSNQWANQVFGQPLLYGPDANQYYVAARRGNRLLSIYLVQRGNRRLYVHLQELTTSDDVAVNADARLVERLTGRGHARIQGVSPNPLGQLGDDDLERLRAVGRRISVLQRSTVYVVCHLYGPGDIDALVTSAGECAESATAALQTEGGPQLKPFAAGPLLPRGDGNRSRIELVMPHFQKR